MEVFQSDQLPRVYKIKHLSMQSAFPDSKCVNLESFSEFKFVFCGSVCEISSLLDIIGIIGKWKC